MDAESRKINIRVIILRVLSVLAVNAFIYAGFLVLRAFIFHDDGGAPAVLLYAAVIAFAHGTGVLLSSVGKAAVDRASGKKFFRFFSFMFNIKDSSNFVSSSALWILIIIPFAAVLAVYGKTGAVRTIFELVLAAVGYAIAVKQSRLSSAKIMSSASLFTGMAIMFVCLELPFLVDRLQYLRTSCFVVSYFMIFAFLIVKNQEDIEKHIFSKKHIDKSVLPKNMRRFNAMAACFVFLLMMLLFNLKKVVMYLLDIAKQIIQFAFYIFGWIVDKLISDVPMGTEGLGDTAIESAPVQPSDPFFNFLTNILMYFVILYASYRLLLAIIVRIPGAVSKIAAVLKKLFRLNASDESSVEADFIDTTETVLPNTQQRIGKIKKKKRAKPKKLSKITDPIEKVRCMYENILITLPAYGVTPRITDTTKEVLEKSAGIEDIREDLSSFTQIYDRVRYGEMVPDGETLTRAEKYYTGCQAKHPAGH